LDAEVVELASTAGVTLVKLMTTDLWEQARNAVTGLFARHAPDRADVPGQLDHSRAELAGAAESVVELTAADLAEQWARRLRWLLSADPAAVQPLRELLAQLTAQLPAAERQQVIQMKAVARDNARIYQAGRDQHIHDLPDQ
jgi:hypothetical protein